MTPSPSLLLLLLHALDNWLEHRKQTCKPTNLGFWSILQLPFDAFLDRQQAREKQAQTQEPPSHVYLVIDQTHPATYHQLGLFLTEADALEAAAMSPETWISPINHAPDPQVTLTDRTAILGRPIKVDHRATLAILQCKVGYDPSGGHIIWTQHWTYQTGNPARWIPDGPPILTPALEITVTTE